MAKKGFKNCYYDKFRDKMYLKEQGDDTFKEIPFSNWCYMRDPSKKSTLTDIYKVPMTKFDYENPEVLKSMSGLAEANLRPEVKIMHKLYDFEELEVDMDAWNICMFDIEVAGSSKYYNNQLILVKNIETEQQLELRLIDFDMKYKEQHSKFKVWDIEHNKWINYDDSCYVSYEFPAPEKADWPINAVTCYSTKTKESYTWGLEPYNGEPEELPNYTYCKTEVELVRKWLYWFAKQNFDIITGWNSVSYDIPYIVNRCHKLRELTGIKTVWEKALSPLGKEPIQKKITDRKMEEVELGMMYTIPGLYSIDYMKVYETFGSHPPMPSYSLNYVANFELGDRKLEYTGAISETYKFDWDNFLKYNRKDVLLIRDLELKNKLFPLIIEYAFDCIVTLDKVEQKVPTTTGYILKFLHKTNRVLNDREDHHVDWWRNERCYITKKNGDDYYQNTEWEEGNKEFQKFKFVYDRYNKPQDPNATVKPHWSMYWAKEDDFKKYLEKYKADPHPFEEFAVKAGYCYDYPGRFDTCMSFDITSSYPHHIMQFNISPEVKVIHPTKEQIESGEVILTDVAELGFRRTDDAILPNVVKQVFAERKIYKNKEKECEAAGDVLGAHLNHNRQMTKKLIINSVYGVSLTSSFPLYDPDCARAICRCARVTLRDWLSVYCNEYYTSAKLIKDVQKYYNVNLKDTTPLKITNRDYAIIHNDTDSSYICIHELRERLISEGRYSNRVTKPFLTLQDGMTNEQIEEIKLKNDEILAYNEDVEKEYREFFDIAEQMFQDFFDTVLQIRAGKAKTKQLIKYNRENEFKNMFCFAKKLYIGNIIDSEGEAYPFESIKNVPFTDKTMETLPKKYIKHKSGQKHKIMGVPIKKSTMPDFCKEAAEDLAFKIAAGMPYQEARDYIIKVYEKFKQSDLSVISSVIGIKNYTKYIQLMQDEKREQFEKNETIGQHGSFMKYEENFMDYFIDHGLEFGNGFIFAAKASLAYNYIIAKDRLKYNPIRNNSKIRYIYVKPSQKIKAKDSTGKIVPIEAIGYLESWPKEFDDYFEIDYETAFRKSFCALFDSMFKIAKWIGPKDHVELEQSPMFEFFA